MAFWRIGNGFSSIPSINKILDEPEPSLKELLEEQNLLQELVAPNSKLIEYLRTPQVMEEMIRIIIDSGESPSKTTVSDAQTDFSTASKHGDGDTNDEQESAYGQNESQSSSAASDTHMSNTDSDSDNEDSAKDDEDGLLRRVASHHDEEENEEEAIFQEDETQDRDTKQRQAQICTEILSADVWSITETLIQSFDLLELLWTVLDMPEPLDVGVASCFAKINEHLLDKKTVDLIMFIQVQKNFVERFMTHIENPPLMDFLLKTISSDKPDSSTGIIDFLQSQKLIPHLISFLGPDVPSSIQTSASDFLKAFITISANSSNDNSTIGPNELSRELVSEPCVSELLRLMLYGGNGLSTAVGVIIEIIRKNNSDYDPVPVMSVTMDSHPPGPRDPIYLGTLVKAFAEAIPLFQEMLTREHDERLETSFGLIEPLGFERFKICELIAELLHCSNMALLNDSTGEEVVHARDVERERVKNVVARARGEVLGEEGASHLSAEAQNNLRSELEFAHEEETEQGLKPAIEHTDNIEDIEKEMNNGPREEHLEEGLEGLNIEYPENSDEKNQSKQPETPEMMPSMALPEYESYLREDPVVGDKLKIAFADNGCITTILNMFFEFPWNNFLHNVVFDIVQQILNATIEQGYNRYLAIGLFGEGRLTQMICEGHAKCEQYERDNGTRLGYMGHLTLISEEVVKFTAIHSPELVSPVVVSAVTKHNWISYVTHDLVHTRDQYNTILGGKRPEETDISANSSAILAGDGEFGEDDAEGAEGRSFDDTENHHKGSGQFVRYISEQMSGAGHFGSSDEEDDDDDWDHDRDSIYRDASQYADYEVKEDRASPRQNEEHEHGGNDDYGDDNLELMRDHTSSYHDI